MLLEVELKAVETVEKAADIMKIVEHVRLMNVAAEKSADNAKMEYKVLAMRIVEHLNNKNKKNGYSLIKE
jgi:hypothetical protein